MMEEGLLGKCDVVQSIPPRQARVSKALGTLSRTPVCSMSHVEMSGSGVCGSPSFMTRAVTSGRADGKLSYLALRGTTLNPVS